MMGKEESRLKFWNSGNRWTQRWVELGIFTPPEMVEAVCDFLMENGSTGVLVEDSNVTSYNYPDKKYINWTLVKAYFYEDDIPLIEKYIEDYFKTLQQVFPNSEPPIIRKSLINNEEWSYSWRRYFEPIEVFEGLVIRPSWTSSKRKNNEIQVVIDPGMAFGTGLHTTTKLALKGLKIFLEELEEEQFVKRKLLDVGTGSGILAITGIKMGFDEALGIDIDPVAIEVSKRNIRLNNLQNKVFVLNKEINDIEEEFECVVANINSSVLVTIKRELSRVVRVGGFLILSGIRWNEAAMVKSEFVTQRFEFFQVEYEQGWSLMIFRKR